MLWAMFLSYLFSYACLVLDNLLLHITEISTLLSKIGKWVKRYPVSTHGSENTEQILWHCLFSKNHKSRLLNAHIRIYKTPRPLSCKVDREMRLCWYRTSDRGMWGRGDGLGSPKEAGKPKLQTWPYGGVRHRGYICVCLYVNATFKWWR